jgi:hypothetical protein
MVQRHRDLLEKRPRNDQRAADHLNATNGLVAAGAGMSIRAKRPTPNSAGKRNFEILSKRKTAPTSRRTRIVPAGAVVLRRFLFTAHFSFNGRSSLALRR